MDKILVNNFFYRIKKQLTVAAFYVFKMNKITIA